MPITGSQPAKMFSQVGVARVGASRVGYTSSLVFVNVGGSYPCVVIDSLTISDELDETPNRATFTLKNAVPTQGQEVVITLGSKNSLSRLFAGQVLSSTQQHRAQFADLLLTEVNALDYTWQLGFQKVTQKYQVQSATVIAKDLVATYAAVNGFTANNVVADLPVLDEITFTNEDLPDAITRLARRIGAYWYVDYAKDVHLFYEETGNPPADLTLTHRSLSALSYERDRTQALSRVYVEGRGSRLLSNVNAGETRIPVEAVDMFLAQADVFLKVSYQGAEGGAKHLDFTGVVPGGGGTLVGPGSGPSSGVTLAVQDGAGVTSGLHQYGVTFTTAAGESLLSPLASISTGEVPNPTVAPSNPWTNPSHGPSDGSQLIVGHQYTFHYAYSTGAMGEPGAYAKTTLVSPRSATITAVNNQDPYNPSMAAAIYFQIPLSPDPRIKSIFIYGQDWTRGDVVQYITGNQISNVPPSSYWYQVRIQGVFNTGAQTPPANTTSQNQIQVSGIPTGSASVTGRKLYRTIAGGSLPLKLLTTIANNTATTYLDTAADGALGANAPGADTSGLQQPPGQVLPGSTTLTIAGTSAFDASGGWAIIGNGEQVIRYSGVSAGTLTGIPASGNGSIVAAIAFNSTITAAAMLTGIPATGSRSIVRELVSGDEVYLVVQVENSSVQSILAAMGGNGWREEWVQDRRLSIPEARARGTATLQLRPADEFRCTYTCRDTRTASGKTIVLNLPEAPFALSATLKIQSVQISNFRPKSGQPPTYTVQASAQHHSFDDLLRRARYKE